MTKKFYGVEYHNDINDKELSTFEIFTTQKEAENYAKTVDAIEIFEADFNTERVFKEPDIKEWNYDDTSDLYENRKTLKTL